MSTIRFNDHSSSRGSISCTFCPTGRWSLVPLSPKTLWTNHVDVTMSATEAGQTQKDTNIPAYRPRRANVPLSDVLKDYTIRSSSGLSCVQREFVQIIGSKRGQTLVNSKNCSISSTKHLGVRGNPSAPMSGLGNGEWRERNGADEGSRQEIKESTFLCFLEHHHPLCFYVLFPVACCVFQLLSDCFRSPAGTQDFRVLKGKISVVVTESGRGWSKARLFTCGVSNPKKYLFHDLQTSLPVYPAEPPATSVSKHQSIFIGC